MKRSAPPTQPKKRLSLRSRPHACSPNVEQTHTTLSPDEIVLARLIDAIKRDEVDEVQSIILDEYPSPTCWSGIEPFNVALRSAAARLDAELATEEKYIVGITSILHVVLFKRFKCRRFPPPVPSPNPRQDREVFQAARRGDIDALSTLDDQEANLKIRDKKGRTPIMVAAENGHAGIVLILLWRTPCERMDHLEDVDDGGKTALMAAAEQGHTLAAFILVNHWIDNQDDPDVYPDETPFMAACTNGHLTTAKLLCRHRDHLITQPTRTGITALMCASARNHVEIVTWLVSVKDAPVEASMPTGETALVFAARYGHVASAAILVRAGALVDAQVAGGMSPLMFAAKKGHVSMVEFLIEAGADMARVDHNGESALDKANKGGHLEVVEAIRRKEKAASPAAEVVEAPGDAHLVQQEAEAEEDPGYEWPGDEYGPYSDSLLFQWPVGDDDY